MSSAPAEGPAAAPRDPHFALFDGMRAVAVLLVMGIHAGNQSGANQSAWYGVFTSHLNLGVNVFFLISGFLLYRPHAVAIFGGPPPPSTGTYALRRFFRIAPAYWVALSLLALWPGLRGVDAERWWIFYGFGQAYVRGMIFWGIPAAWSLTVEVAFYASLPALAWMLRRLCRGLARGAALQRQLLVLAGLGVLAELVRNLADPSYPIYKVSFPGLGLDFAVGMSLAVVSAFVGTREQEWPALQRIARSAGPCWLLAGGLYCATCFTPVFGRSYAQVYTPATFALEHLVYVSVATLLLLPAVFGESQGGWPRRLLASRALSSLGTISYGVFLWHQPLMSIMVHFGLHRWLPGAPFLGLLLLNLPVSLFFGWASYRLIERPAMRLSGSHRRALARATRARAERAG